MRIMISAAASPTAHGIIRHLQRLGHFVIGHDCCPDSTSVANQHLRSPPVATEPWEYSRFIKTQEYDLYLPFLDEELIHFTNPTYGIPPKTLCSGPGILKSFTDKLAQSYLLHDVSPRLTIDGDVIAKPRHGRGGRGHIRTKDPRIALRLRESGNYLVQEFVEGTEYTVDVLTDMDGKFLFAVPRRRIRANGVSLIGRIDMDEDLINEARRITEDYQFVGPFNFQVIRRENKYYVIEVNARLSGSCMFTVMAGFDILRASIRVFCRQAFIPPEVKEITICRHYEEEIIQ